MTEKIAADIDSAGLRSFGLVTAVMITLVFGYLIPWIWDHPMPSVSTVQSLWKWPPDITKTSLPLFISAILATIALIIPILLKPFYFVWMYVAFILGWINTRLILGILFYLLFTPIGILMKILRQDPMNRKTRTPESSYRQPSHQLPKSHVERPF